MRRCMPRREACSRPVSPRLAARIGDKLSQAELGWAAEEAQEKSPATPARSDEGPLLTGSYSLHVPDIARRVLASQARERQQKDEFCGPFWVVAAVAALTGQVVTQDDAAVAAGTLLTAGGGRLSDLPPGAASRADTVPGPSSSQAFDTRMETKPLKKPPPTRLSG